jgi:hypothetical protein
MDFVYLLTTVFESSLNSPRRISEPEHFRRQFHHGVYNQYLWHLF